MCTKTFSVIIYTILNIYKTLMIACFILDNELSSSKLVDNKFLKILNDTLFSSQIDIILQKKLWNLTLELKSLFRKYENK